MVKAETSLLALYGGTFDPIHYGHLKPVEALACQIQLSQVLIMPNNVPPHRPQPLASSAQRKAMIELAIAGNPLFKLDDRELARATPSWTVETLEQLRAELGPYRPLAFIIGQDSLLTLQSWHRWQDLLTLCHLLVCQRPGYALSMESPQQQLWLDSHRANEVAQLHQLPTGKIWLAPTPLYNISATLIRQRLAQGQSCEDLLPPQVLDFIYRQRLYR